MIDGTILTIIPPIIASVLTYIVAAKRSKINQLKAIAEIQNKAIELVQNAEEKMRLELRQDIDKLRGENDSLRKKIDMLETQRTESDRLTNTLKLEITTLKDSIDRYKQIIKEKKSGKPVVKKRKSSK